MRFPNPLTFSGLYTGGEQMGQHLGIQQVRVDLAAGQALEPARSLWSGTGLKFPEAPHLYQRGGSWYLMIAEGGTERGHGVSVARGPSPEGGDRIRLLAGGMLVAELDGRYWTAQTCASFTGRVIGPAGAPGKR